ncbi:MAG: hypothetical protein ACXAEU_14095 [Candidatus Hodarchaeales archaeon]|jgi:hypothetical protein
MSSGNEESIEGMIEGLICTIFEDYGPTPVFNESFLDDTQAFNLGIKIMTVLGNSEPREIYGPLSVPDDNNKRMLAYLFNVKSDESSDPRIKQFGRSVVISLIFSKGNEWAVRQASGLIKSYLTLLVAEIENEVDVSFDRMKIINKKVMLLVSQIKIRVYKISEYGAPIEDLLYGGEMLQAKTVLVADLQDNILHVLIQVPIPTMLRAEVTKQIDDFNKANFSYKMKKSIVDDTKQIQSLLNKYKIRQIQAPIAIDEISTINLPMDIRHKIELILKDQDFRKRTKIANISEFIRAAAENYMKHLGYE